MKIKILMLLTFLILTSSCSNFDTNNSTHSQLDEASSSNPHVVNSHDSETYASHITDSTNKYDEDKVVILFPSWSIYYKDEQELTEASDLVVKGIVVEEVGSSFTKGEHMTYTTEVDVLVIEVLKGDKAPDEIVTVSQMGGFDGEITVISKGTTLLKQQQEVVLFLQESSDGKYRPINEDDGIYLLENGSRENLNSHNEVQ